MNKIYTSYFAKIRHIKYNIDKPCFINIARFIKPEIFKDMHMSIEEFMPSSSILRVYKNNITWKNLKKQTEEEYEQAYLKELEENKDKIELLLKKHIVPKLEYFDNIFLMCYEKSGDFCHRNILRKFLKDKFNLNIEEYI